MENIQEKGIHPSATPKECRICGDAARGLNFNVVSCMSCKSFFRRNAYKIALLSQCQFENNCSITQRTRSYCSPCRLKKCFELGMEPELIRSLPNISTDSRKMKRMKRTKEKQLQLPTPAPLGLLQNDRSTLTSNEWNLLSNVLHTFDRHDIGRRIQYSLDDLSSLPPKLRMKSLELAKLFHELYSGVGSIIEQSNDFSSLSVDSRRIVVKHNFYMTGIVNGIFLSRELHVFDNDAVVNACRRHYGPEHFMNCLQTIARFDPNGCLVKIFLFIMAFSTNCSIVKFDTEANVSEIPNPLHLFHLQNIYVTMLWKYLVYQDGFYAATMRFTRFVKNLLDSMNLSYASPQTETRIQLVNCILAKAEKSLVLLN